MTPKQEAALREYLQEAIVPLIEQVLVKKLGQAMSFAAEELIQPKPAQQQEPVCDKDPQGCWSVRCQLGKVCKNTSPPASKPHGFAGVTAWIGDATVTRIVTRVQIQHERVAGQSMTQAARVCLDMLAAHGIKGDA